MTGLGRTTLLRAQSEVSWQEQVMSWALSGGWCGVHVRKSKYETAQKRFFATLMGIHTLRHHADHDDDDGFPDWLFGRAGGPLIFAELKTVTGTLTRDQRRWLHLFNSIPGLYGVLWRPTDADAVRTILIGHDWTALDQFRVYQTPPERRFALKPRGHPGLSIGQSTGHRWAT